MIPLPSNVCLLLIVDDENQYALPGIVKNNVMGVLQFHGTDGKIINFNDEWLQRAKKITPDLVSVFGSEAAYYIPLTVGNIPEDADPTDFKATGFKLPGSSSGDA